MIPDLKYPEEARKAVDSFLSGIAYDASVAISGIALSKTPLPDKSPDFSVPIRCGGTETDQALRRDAPLLFSRFALISMISRFDVYVQDLLLQRRVIEFLGGTVKKMDSTNMWRILKQVQKESRSGTVHMCNGMLIVSPSADLQARMLWLDGLNRVRNCLAHRLGRVQMVDVQPPGVPLDQTKDTDRLRAVWIRARFSIDGKEASFPTPAMPGKEGTFEFVESTKEWKIGDQIDVDPADTQSIAITFSFLGTQLEADFEREMNHVLQLPTVASSPGEMQIHVVRGD